jgi:hypothetical protein
MSDPTEGSESQAVKCAKCGSLIPEGVKECPGCGASLLPPETTPAPHRQVRVALMPRLVISLVTGLLVFGIACEVGYRQYCGSAARVSQARTLADIGRVCRALEAYRHEKHALPRTLRNLPPVALLHFGTDGTGAPLDWWRRQLHYWTDGTSYRVSSYGRDGKPGGVGFDYDVSSDDLETKQAAPTGWWNVSLPKQARPTFWQFVTDLGQHYGTGSGSATFLAAILSGAVAFFLGYQTIGRSAPTRRGRWVLFGGLLLTTAGTLVVAIMYLIPLHIPSGH